MFSFFLVVSWFESPFPTRTMRSGEAEVWSEGIVCDPLNTELFCSGTFHGGGGGGGGKTILKINGGYNICSGRRAGGA